MSGQTKLPAVIVMDAMELRRAGVVALVEPWAGSLEITTVAISPSSLCGDTLENFDPRFVIFCIGGSSLHAAEPIQWARTIRELLPEVPCAVLSDRIEADEAIVAAKLGVQAFMPTSIEPQVALQAFAFILGGGTFFPREALLQTVAAARETGDSRAALPGETGRLTRRQYEVMERLRLGSSNKLIARQLDMQESTVKVHVRQIMRKLGAANRTQAALLAADAGRTRDLLPSTLGLAAERQRQPGEALASGGDVLSIGPVPA